MKKPNLMRMAIVVAAVALAPSILPASATPVCYEAPEAACGFRIFPEAYQTATFLQLGNGEYEGGIRALAARFPRYVRVNSLDVLLDDPTAVSFGGRKIWVIEVTDFQSPEEGKLPVVVSTGVHATEPAGREGSVRYAEDLVRWATTDPGHLLRNGTDPDSTAFPVSEVLQSVHLYLAAINPDGWEAGDLANGGLYNRGNDQGEDLNREFPTIGWTNTGNLPLTSPEAIAWTRFVESIDPVTTADLHGELNSANNAYADIMLPAGQWDPQFQAQQEAMARHMRSNIDRYFREKTVALGQIEEVPLQPAEYATGYDVVGYDAAGFMGDYFTQLGAVDLDIEHMFSHLVPSSVWIPLHEHAHIAAVRAEIETIMVEAMVTNDVQVSLDLGRIGYLFDPRVVTDADADGYGGPDSPDQFESYSATPMQYFEDLGRYTTESVEAVASADIAPGIPGDYGALEGLDSFVVNTWPAPPDTEGRDVNVAATVKFIKRFVEQGGNLILTDEGLKVLEELDIAADGSVTRNNTNAGHVDITNFNDAYTQKLNSTASQTYYEVALGYRDTNQAPHWSVPTSAWTSAGGQSFGTVASGRTGLGRITLGQGQIGILGALLPPATEKNAHHYGLADYGVTVTGGQILNNMLGFSLE
jgi:hypothetical protein